MDNAPFWREGVHINPYILGAIGLGLGWLAGMMSGRQNTVGKIENLLVGVFGAFVGGDWWVSTYYSVGDKPTLAGVLMWAVAGAVLLLILLRLLRHAMGEVKISKGNSERRR